MSLSKEEVLESIAQIVHDETGIDKDSVQLDKAFIDDLDIDSISMMTIVVNAEEKYGIEIPDDKVKDLRTVGDAVNFIIAAKA